MLGGDVKAEPHTTIIMPNRKEEWDKSEDAPFPTYDLHTFQWVRSRKAAGLPVDEFTYDGPSHVIAMQIMSILLACHKAKRRGNEKYARALMHNLATQFCRELGQSEITDEGAPDFALEMLDAIHFCVITSSGRTGMPREPR